MDSSAESAQATAFTTGERRNFIRLNIGCAKCLLEVAMDAMKGLYKADGGKSAVQAGYRRESKNRRMKRYE